MPIFVYYLKITLALQKSIRPLCFISHRLRDFAKFHAVFLFSFVTMGNRL